MEMVLFCDVCVGDVFEWGGFSFIKINEHEGLKESDQSFRSFYADTGVLI